MLLPSKIMMVLLQIASGLYNLSYLSSRRSTPCARLLYLVGLPASPKALSKQSTSGPSPECFVGARRVAPDLILTSGAPYRRCEFIIIEITKEERTREINNENFTLPPPASSK
jgi:hypothetical protein